MLVAIPLDVTPRLSKLDEAGISDYTWILNYALSFGVQEWDVVGISPSVQHAGLPTQGQDRDDFARHLMHAQDLSVITRDKHDLSVSPSILAAWMKAQHPSALSSLQFWVGCHGHGFAWPCFPSMPTQGGGHGTQESRFDGPLAPPHFEQLKPPRARRCDPLLGFIE